MSTRAPRIHSACAAVLVAAALALPARAAPPPADAKAAPADAKPVEEQGADAKAAPAPEAKVVDAAAPAADAAPAAPARPRNRSLEYAKELLGKGRFDDALKELDTAASLPGNGPLITAEIHATRAQALLLKPKADAVTARELIVEVLHVDPEATLLAGAAPKVAELVEKVRAEQVLVLHERILVARSGRPLRFRARLVDPKSRVAGLTIRYRPRGISTWSEEPMRRDVSGYTGFLRDPSALAPPGIQDGYFVEYFIVAKDASGAVLDSNGSEDVPVETEISATKAEQSGLGQAVDLNAVLELREQPLVEAAPAVAPYKPWYRRWYTITAAGVVLAGIAAGTAVALSQEDPPLPHIVTLDFGRGK